LSDKDTLQKLDRGGAGSYDRKNIKYLLAIYTRTTLFQSTASNADDQGAWFSAEQLQSTISGWEVLDPGFVNTAKRHMNELVAKGYVLHRKRLNDQVDIYCITKEGIDETRKLLEPLRKGITPGLVPLAAKVVLEEKKQERETGTEEAKETPPLQDITHELWFMPETARDGFVSELMTSIRDEGLAHRVSVETLEDDFFWHVAARPTTVALRIDGHPELVTCIKTLVNTLRKHEHWNLKILVSSNSDLARGGWYFPSPPGHPTRLIFMPGAQ